MSIDSNVPVLYLDSYNVDMKCFRHWIDIRIINEMIPLPENEGLLIVLGRYSDECKFKPNHGMIYSKQWTIYNKNIQFQMSDPDHAVIGNFSINLSGTVPMVIY